MEVVIESKFSVLVLINKSACREGAVKSRQVTGALGSYERKKCKHGNNKRYKM